MRPRKERVAALLERVPELPTLSEVVTELERVAKDPETGIRDIAVAIEKDPSMAARVLRVANSSFYRKVTHPLTTIPQAVAHLGLDEVRRLCLTIGASHLFAKPSSRFEHTALWTHSVTVACITRIVCKEVVDVRIDPEQAYVAGLLHEVGALVLDQFFGKVYDPVFRMARRESLPIEVLEQEYIGADHGEIGAWLLERWGLPESLVAAVHFHHDPMESPEELRALCQLVHVSDFICSMHGSVGPGENLPYPILASAWEDLGVDLHMVTDLADEVFQTTKHSRMLVSVSAA